MSSQPSDFKLEAPPEFAAKIASIYAQFGEIEKKHGGTKESKSDSSIQKGDPEVLRDDEFAIPKGKLQLDRRNNFSSSSSEVASHKPPFEFRRPKMLPRPRAKIPDHKLHPQNWTKYSLASVEESQMSDGANTAAALSYLKQQGRRSEGQELWDEDTQLLDLRAKVMFHGKKKKDDRLRPKFLTGNTSEGAENSETQTHSPSVHSSESSDETTRSVFDIRVRPQVESRFTSHARVALSHLQEDGDEDEEENDDILMNVEDDAMRFEENITKNKSDGTLEDESNSSNRDDMPKLKKFKRAKMSPSEKEENEDTDSSAEKP